MDSSQPHSLLSLGCIRMHGILPSLLASSHIPLLHAGTGNFYRQQRKSPILITSTATFDRSRPGPDAVLFGSSGSQTDLSITSPFVELTSSRVPSHCWTS
ncbi:hypothetical protein KC19_5G134500 [Ceratodon purpureus]|uniref:Uncharacterized protein n=1 Tax=Ceratodon purpureus TaxID=3225 RepID=A0A8T0I2I5_CERPU|nr:hypothetical protein KC19_5G134500 [Ceratodon purpureus]